MIRRILAAFFLCSAVAHASTTIAVNDATLVAARAPYNSVLTGSTSVQSTNPGYYDRFTFTGTSISVTVDMTAINAIGTGGGAYPVIAYTVDGSRSTRQLLSTDTTIALATGLADTTHTFRLDFIGTDESGNTNRWSNPPPMSLVILNYIIDTGKSVGAPAAFSSGAMLSYGDSIDEGAVALAAADNPPYYAQVEDATKAWSSIVANNLNLAYGKVAFAGQGWNSSSTVSGVPGLDTSWNLIWTSTSRTFSPTPTVVTVNMGTNNRTGVTATTVQTFMENLRAAVGPTCWINMVTPFNQNAQSLTVVNGGYAAYVAAHPSDAYVNLIDLGSAGAAIVTANSYDGVHPNAAGHVLLAAAIMPLLRYPTGGTLTATTLSGGVLNF